MASRGKKKRGCANGNGTPELCDNPKTAVIEGGVDDCGENMDVQEHVEVDFEARNPEDSDFHGIKKLLQQLFLKANINISELSDTIISQNYVGSVIKQAYDEELDDSDEDSDTDMDVYGVTSVINITERENLESVKQLKEYLIGKCKQCSPNHMDFSSLVHNPAKQIGFLINERFINIPPQLSLPAFQSLWKEVERACKKKMRYDFSDFVMVCKTYRMPAVGGLQSDAAQVFVNAEEELFAQEASLRFDYSVQSERDSAIGGADWDEEQEEMEPFRTVLVVPSHKIQAIMDNLTANFSQV